MNYTELNKTVCGDMHNLEELVSVKLYTELNNTLSNCQSKHSKIVISYFSAIN